MKVARVALVLAASVTVAAQPAPKPIPIELGPNMTVRCGVPDRCEAHLLSGVVVGKKLAGATVSYGDRREASPVAAIVALVAGENPLTLGGTVGEIAVRIAWPDAIAEGKYAVTRAIAMSALGETFAKVEAGPVALPGDDTPRAGALPRGLWTGGELGWKGMPTSFTQIDWVLRTKQTKIEIACPGAKPRKTLAFHARVYERRTGRLVAEKELRPSAAHVDKVCRQEGTYLSYDHESIDAMYDWAWRDLRGGRP